MCDCRWWRSSAKLLKQLTGAPLEVAETVRQQLQSFQQHLPLIAALRNPGLRDGHWDKISAAVGFTVKADAGMCCVTLNDRQPVTQAHMSLHREDVF